MKVSSHSLPVVGPHTSQAAATAIATAYATLTRVSDRALLTVVIGEA